MKQIRQGLTVWVFTFFAVLFFSICPLAAGSQIDSGRIGSDPEYIDWVLTGTDNNLTLDISGTGFTSTTYISASPGWISYKDRIKRLIINEGVSFLGGLKFQGYTTLESAIFPHGFRLSGIADFNGCSSLKTVQLPSDMSFIGGLTFAGCTSLENIVIPSGVTSIQDYSFEGCSALREISLSGNVNLIGEDAFKGCTNLKKIYIQNGNAEVELNAISRNTRIYSHFGGSVENYANIYNVPFSPIDNTSISGTSVMLSQTDYVQDGTEKKPAVTVKYSITTLTEGVDYTCQYKNNVYQSSSAKPTVVITGIGTYSGTKETYFTITAITAPVVPSNQNTQNTDASVPVAAPTSTPTVLLVSADPITIAKPPASVRAKAKKNKVTVSWKKIKKTKKAKKLLTQIKGIQVQYSTDLNFEQDVVTKKTGKNKTRIILKLKTKSTYYIRIRYVGSDGVSNWSKIKKVKMK